MHFTHDITYPQEMTFTEFLEKDPTRLRGMQCANFSFLLASPSLGTRLLTYKPVIVITIHAAHWT